MDFTKLAAQPDSSVRLAETALALASEHYPELDASRYLAMLDKLGASAKKHLGRERDQAARLERFISFLHDEEGFQGNSEHYYDPRNSYLNEVLERRLGVPISLAVIWLEVAKRAGFALSGISFPSHFLVRHHDLLADPFYGRVIDEEECRVRLRETPGAPAFSPGLLEPATNRQILSRMLGNLKHIYIQSNAPGSALGCCERILQLFPDSPSEVRDRGILNLSLERYYLAIEDFQHFLAAVPKHPTAPLIREKLAELQEKVALFH